MLLAHNHSIHHPTHVHNQHSLHTQPPNNSVTTAAWVDTRERVSSCQLHTDNNPPACRWRLRPLSEWGRACCWLRAGHAGVVVWRHPHTSFLTRAFAAVSVVATLLLPLTPTCSVIKVILQFCKENGLTESFNALQVDTQPASSSSIRRDREWRDRQGRSNRGVAAAGVPNTSHPCLTSLLHTLRTLHPHSDNTE